MTLFRLPTTDDAESLIVLTAADVAWLACEDKETSLYFLRIGNTLPFIGHGKLL